LRGRISIVDRRKPLTAARFEHVSEIAGGIAAWAAGNLPVEVQLEHVCAVICARVIELPHGEGDCD
jgi:hypothetical protein